MTATLLLRRRAFSILRFVVLLFLVSVATFLLLELIPGDRVDGLLPEGATDEMRQQVIDLYGLDRPMIDRYLSWVGGILQGDFGTSLQTKVPVAETLAKRAPVTLELGLLAIALSLLVSVPLGVYSAYRPNGIVDKVVTFIASITLAIPPFVFAVIAIYVFGFQLRWFPIVGWTSFGEDPLAHVRSMVLPVLTLAAPQMVLFIRLLKGDMMGTLQQDYVLSARARGLPTWRILVRHALRPSSFSLVTVSGVVVGNLLGGAVIIEQIFSIPGLGSMVITSINTRDFIGVQAVVLISAVVYLLLNTLVDLTYPLLDPRVRKASR
jgi:peptide/nickel transport system permease protein